MEIGELIDGKYELVRMLGRGAMGTVYLGEHRILGKKVAIKVLHEQFASNPVFVERFYREARSAASVGHRGIVEVHDVGQTPDGALFLVMEHLEGKSLSTMLRARKTLDVDEAVDIAVQILSALSAVHEKGIVHRDIKPGNIFLCTPSQARPIVKLLDFGVSKITGEDLPDLTTDKDVVGTLSYMSPEQARRSRDADHQSDLWAVGAIVYQMLLGRLPHKGGSIDQILMSLMTDEFPAPTTLREDIPDDLDAAIMKALQRDVNERYTDAVHFMEALTSACSSVKTPEWHKESTTRPPADDDGPTGVYPTPKLGVEGSGDNELPETQTEVSSRPGDTLEEDTEVSSPSQDPASAPASFPGHDLAATDSYPSADSSGGVVYAPPSMDSAMSSGGAQDVGDQSEPSSSGGLDTFAAVATNVSGALPPRALMWVALSAFVMGVSVMVAAMIIVFADEPSSGEPPRNDRVPPARSTSTSSLASQAGVDALGSSPALGEVSDEAEHDASTATGVGQNSTETASTAEAGAVTPEGTPSLSTKEISIALRRVRPEALRCLAADASGPAKIYVNVEVDGTGATYLKGATPRPSNAVLGCLRHVVEELRFRRTDGESVEVRYPYGRSRPSGSTKTKRGSAESASPSSPGANSLKRSPFRR